MFINLYGVNLLLNRYGTGFNEKIKITLHLNNSTGDDESFGCSDLCAVLCAGRSFERGEKNATEKIQLHIGIL